MQASSRAGQVLQARGEDAARTELETATLVSLLLRKCRKPRSGVDLSSHYPRSRVFSSSIPLTQEVSKPGIFAFDSAAHRPRSHSTQVLPRAIDWLGRWAAFYSNESGASRPSPLNTDTLFCDCGAGKVCPPRF